MKEVLEASLILENALNLRHFFRYLSPILQSLCVTRVCLFGSLVNNKYDDDSDIDIALFIYGGINLAYLNTKVDSVVAEVGSRLEEEGYKVEIEGYPQPGSIHLRGVLVDGCGIPIDFINYENSLILWDNEI